MPPFDASGLRQQRLVGAGVVLLLAGAVAWVLLLSGRSIGPGTTFHVETTTTGPLRAGAKVRLAGREVGEVRGATARQASATNPVRSVDFEVFVARAWVSHVHRNSQFFVSTPSVLGEAYLEIGPPAGDAEPGPTIAEGERVRGADPPDIDSFFVHAEASIREVLALLREDRPALDELLQEGDKLIATLSALPADKGQLGRIVDQAAAALDQGRSLVATVQQAGGIERMRRIGRDLAAIADRAGPDLRELGNKLDVALERVDKMKELFSTERRAQVSTAVASFRRVVTLGQQLVADVLILERKLTSGQGSIGAFLQDKELFDDLHDTHRIIKSQPLRFLLKTVKPKERIVP